jgi:hypothetical protein
MAQKNREQLINFIFLQFLVIKALDPYTDHDSLEMLDLDPYPDPDSMNPDPQHCFLGQFGFP